MFVSCAAEFLIIPILWLWGKLRQVQVNRIAFTTGNLTDTLSESKLTSPTVLSGTGVYQELWLMFSQQNSSQPLPELRWNWK